MWIVFQFGRKQLGRIAATVVLDHAVFPLQEFRDGLRLERSTEQQESETQVQAIRTSTRRKLASSRFIS